MKKYISFIIVIVSAQCLRAGEGFESIRQKTYLGVLPRELVTELESFSARQVFDAIHSAKDEREAFQKVGELASNPINAKYFYDPNFMDNVLFLLAKKSAQMTKCALAVIDVAKTLSFYVPATSRWITDIYPSEKELGMAVNSEQLDKVKSLIDQGVNVDARIFLLLATPLLETVSRALHDPSTWMLMVLYFLDKGANVNAQNCDGGTALMRAVNAGDTKMAQLLIEHGANPLITRNKRWNSKTAFEDTVAESEMDTILKSGLKNASPNEQLFWAVKNLDQNEVKNLIEKEHADVNALDEYSKTPLMHSRSQIMADYLIKQGAEVNAPAA